MATKGNPVFKQVDAPIQEAVSKFGGQPNWISEPEWPLDKKKGEQMMFVGQIRLDDDLFSGTQGEMAYIFIDADEDADDTWDPNLGQNAIVIQPGNNSMSTVNQATGPTGQLDNEFSECEVDPNGLSEFRLTVELEPEPDYLNDAEMDELIDSDEEKYDAYAQAMETSKIGGAPFFIQGEEIPIEGDWRLLFQLEEHIVPVYVNFGTGVAYGLIDADGTYGKMLWQC